MTCPSGHPRRGEVGQLNSSSSSSSSSSSNGSSSNALMLDGQRSPRRHTLITVDTTNRNPRASGPASMRRRTSWRHLRCRERVDRSTPIVSTASIVTWRHAQRMANSTAAATMLHTNTTNISMPTERASFTHTVTAMRVLVLAEALSVAVVA